ncbi:hypothetical protein [Hungatella sp.]|uniref:hypothetical protein n=1 Tax=Hungatella sp. TaxID=2613924 RepID=UPI003992DF99
MGTCGLVGPLASIPRWRRRQNGLNSAGLLSLPAVLTLVFGEFLRKAGWIREGDLKLDL